MHNAVKENDKSAWRLIQDDKCLTHDFSEWTVSGKRRAKTDRSGNSDQTTPSAGSLKARHVLASLARTRVQDSLS